VKLGACYETMMGDKPWEIVLDNVRVPASHRVGAEGEGMRFGQQWLNIGRVKHGARALGVAERCIEMATSYAKQRSTFGSPLAERQAVQWMLADSAVEIEAALYHVPRAAVRARAAEVLDVVGLGAHADRLVMTYSGGMKKRLELACGLLHRPEVLFLDEPSLGLDVQSRHAMWDHVRALRDGGVTVLLATNYLDEADRICDRLTIIDRGRAVATGTPAELKRGVGDDVLLVDTAERERLMQIVRDAPWATRVAAPDSVVHVYVRDASVALPALMRLALDAGIPLARLSYTQPTLDDVFLLHTGRELREAA
jgi:ABC-2 type transport system ATP-binding protein